MMLLTQLSNIGPIKNLVAPPDWEKTCLRIPLPNHLQLPLFIFRPPVSKKDLEIGVFFRGRMETETDGRVFSSLIKRNQHISEKQTLTANEIKDLSPILDITGFNQYSFGNERSGFSPDFHLRSAELIPLNGKIVLKVVGDFLTDQNVDTYFYGIYIDADGTGRKIYEVFLRASDKEEFMQSLSEFKTMLDSISWN